MDRSTAAYMLCDSLHKRVQQEGHVAHPFGQGRTVDLDALAGVDYVLAVQGKMIAILRDQHMGQQARTRQPALAALRNAGRMVNRHNTTMYTTLQPCFMCTGAIAQFGIPRVVIGDVINASNDETVRFMRSRGIEVIIMDPATSKAAGDCVELVGRFRQEKPDQWLEDWGGGLNSRLKVQEPI